VADDPPQQELRVLGRRRDELAVQTRAMGTNASSTAGSKWVPRPCSNTRIVSSKLTGSLYGRREVSASKTSAMAKMRACIGMASPLSPCK